MNLVVVPLFLVAAAAASTRWLRVAQREHYLPGQVASFSMRWWRASVASVLLGLAAIVGAIAAIVTEGPAQVAALVTTFAAVTLGPPGLGLRGRTAQLKWTRRLKLVAVIDGLLLIAIAATLTRAGQVGGLGIVAICAPLIVDLALALDSPIETLLRRRYVRSAQERLRKVDPFVIAVTGSYGKTTVKVYVAHLLGQGKRVVATRASFNNMLGLARSVNEDLVPGTEVFIAEMGTYGPGEIRQLTAWLPPDVAAITAIGPVHLERMKSVDNIVRAKSEIFEKTKTVVLNVDSPELRRLAESAAADGKHVVRCSSLFAESDVQVRTSAEGLAIRIGTEEFEPVQCPPGVVPVNIAVAIGICLAADMRPPDLHRAILSLPPVPNRLTVTQDGQGPTVIDDTYNSNPAGAAHALKTSRAHVATGRKLYVVTPGMVELGLSQRRENENFATEVAQTAGELIVVGHTNRAALCEGYRRGTGSVEPVVVKTREDAVKWLRGRAGPGDVILFENDLPDHYP